MTTIWKDALHHMSKGKCKLKQQWDATTHLSEWLKCQKTDNRKCSWRLGATGTLIHCWWKFKLVLTLEGSLGVSYKTKHTLTTWSSNHSLWYLTKGIENMSTHLDIYSRFIHNCQNLEANYMSLSRLMDT